MDTLNKFLVIAAILAVGVSLGSTQATAKATQDHMAWGKYLTANNSMVVSEEKDNKAWLLYTTSTRLW